MQNNASIQFSRALSPLRSLRPLIALAPLVLLGFGCSGDVGRAEPAGTTQTTTGATGATGGPPLVGGNLTPPAGTTSNATGGIGATTSNGGSGSPGGSASATTGPMGNMDAGFSDAGSQADSGADASAPGCGDAIPYASDLRIDEIALYQAVKIPIVQNGVAVAERNAPVVRGRDALVRVFVTPLSAFTTHEVLGVLSITTAGTGQEFTARLTPAVGSTDGAMNSTFNFDLDGALLSTDTTYSFSLLEEDCADGLGSADTARFPTSSERTLNASETGSLKITLVPVHYTGDGEDRTPDTSAPVLSRMRDLLYSYYPVTDVELTVRSPLDWSSPVRNDHTGWDSLLDAILALQSQEAEPDEYFYGLITPKVSFGSYCAPGCTAGLGAFFQGLGAVPSSAVGVGYDDVFSRETVIHEVGHTHGREHAPCDVAPADDDFPYAGGGIGVWGYDLLTGELKSPAINAFKDVMGYCSPIWVSDYTYSAWASWVRGVNNQAYKVRAPDAPAQWRSIVLSADGSAHWGRWQPSWPPPGPRELVEVRDASGQVLSEIEIVRVKTSAPGGQFILLPDEPELRAVGAELALPEGTLQLHSLTAAP